MNPDRAQSSRPESCCPWLPADLRGGRETGSGGLLQGSGIQNGLLSPWARHEEFEPPRSKVLLEGPIVENTSPSLESMSSESDKLGSNSGFAICSLAVFVGSILPT